MISIDVTTDAKAEEFLKRFAGKFPGAVRDGIDESTALLEKQIKFEVVRGGSFRKRKGQPYVKNPGAHLRRGDGTLARSWRLRPAKRSGNRIEGSVSSNVVYSAIHEFGGTAGRGVRLRKRPYVEPVMRRELRTIQNIVLRRVVRAFRSTR